VATALGVALAPRMIFAGSPGTRWIKMNAARLIPIKTGIAWTARLRR